MYTIKWVASLVEEILLNDFAFANANMYGTVEWWRCLEFFCLVVLGQQLQPVVRDCC